MKQAAHSPYRRLADDLNRSGYFGEVHVPAPYDETGLATTVLVQTSSTEIQGYVDHVSSTVLVVTSETDKQSYLDSVSTIVLVQTTEADLQGYIEHLIVSFPDLILVVTEATGLQGYTESLSQVVLVVTSCEDIQGYADEHLTTTVLVQTSATDSLLWSVLQVVKVQTTATDSLPNMLEHLVQPLTLRQRINVWQRTPTGQIIVGDPPVRISGS